MTSKHVARLLSRGEPGNHYDGQGLRLEIRGKNAASWWRRIRGPRLSVRRARIFIGARAKRRGESPGASGSSDAL